MSAFRYESTPPAPPTLAAAVGRLCALAGAPPPVLEGTERDAFATALPALARSLAPLLPDLGGSLLARLLAGPRFDGEADLASLPRDARKALKKGEIFATSESDVWILEEQPDGTARISHAHPESIRVLGESLGEWLDAEAQQVEATRRPKPRGAAAKAAVGKPAIDAALLRLAATAGRTEAEVAELAARLADTPPGSHDTRWEYLVRAAAACGPIWSPAQLEALDGRLLGRVLRGRLDDSDDESCIVEESEKDLDGINPIYVKRYPKAARALLTSGHFIASSGPELWLLLREPTGKLMNWKITLFHTAYDGFEALGVLEDWLKGEVDRLGA